MKVAIFLNMSLSLEDSKVLVCGSVNDSLTPRTLHIYGSYVQITNELCYLHFIDIKLDINKVAYEVYRKHISNFNDKGLKYL